MPTLHVKLVTPENLLIEKEAAGVTLPIVDGEVTILPDHEPYIGALHAGEVAVHFLDGQTEYLAVSSGIVEFDSNQLSILADTAERAEAIDIARAEAAKQRAEELRHQAVTMGEEEYARLAGALEKELTRIKVARRHATRRGLHISSD